MPAMRLWLFYLLWEKTTNELIEQARNINPRASRRELDMLLTCGEQMSVALMAMALQSMGVPAISLNAWQVAMHTSSAYGNARLKKIDTERIQAELESGKVVVITGFQGINKYDDYTTLGREAQTRRRWLWQQRSMRMPVRFIPTWKAFTRQTRALYPMPESLKKSLMMKCLKWRRSERRYCITAP